MVDWMLRNQGGRRSAENGLPCPAHLYRVGRRDNEQSRETQRKHLRGEFGASSECFGYLVASLARIWPDLVVGDREVSSRPEYATKDPIDACRCSCGLLSVTS